MRLPSLWTMRGERNLRHGFSRAWHCLTVGDGQTSARRCTSRRNTSKSWPSAAVWPMVRAAAVELWAKKPRCESTRSGKSVQRISMFSPSASKPSYRETERGHRGTTLCFVIVWRCRGPACTRANFRSPASAAISTMSLRKRNGDYSERWRKSLGGLRFCHSIRKHWKAAKLK